MRTPSIAARIPSASAVLGWLLLLLLAAVVALPAPAIADDLPRRADEQVLSERALQFWARVNEARRDPLAAAARLGIDEKTVRIVFADTPWVLDAGLPPLAWNGLLRNASAAHGRDMFDRGYYGHRTPEGWYYDGRVAAAGYQASYTGESISGLFFSNFVPFEYAFDYLFDILLYDELTGNTAVERNVFSPDLTEAGIAFFAETGNPTGDRRNPYSYVLVATFATPVEPRSFLIGTYDASGRPAVRSLAEGVWRYVSAEDCLEPGVFQVSWAKGGMQSFVVSGGGLGINGEIVTARDDYTGDNRLIDLQSLVIQPIGVAGQ